jgi:hypothetical protein
MVFLTINMERSSNLVQQRHSVVSTIPKDWNATISRQHHVIKICISRAQQNLTVSSSQILSRSGRVSDHGDDKLGAPPENALGSVRTKNGTGCMRQQWRKLPAENQAALASGWQLLLRQIILVAYIRETDGQLPAGQGQNRILNVYWYCNCCLVAQVFSPTSDLATRFLSLPCYDLASSIL